MRKFVTIMSLVLLSVTLLLPIAEAAPKVSVGAKNFTEQYVVGNLISLLLKANGFDVKEVFGVGSTIAREGLKTGQTDLYAEYTGTAWLNYLNHDEQITEPVELYQKVKQEDLEKNEIVWLDRFPLNNTYALAIKKEDVSIYGTSISQLAEYVNAHPGEVKFGSNHEFFERPDGFFGMTKAYGMNVSENVVAIMDTGLTYESVASGQINIAMVFATDGKLKKFGLQVLDDDKNFFPVYNLCVTIRQEILDQYPGIQTILQPLAELLDNETIQELNYRVDAEEIPAKIVAKEFLEKHNLLK
ncbi:MAG: glycine betaine ABC transporter substrate-binding protein [Candidatus Vecturithrix sp.]|jgi:osmoprotectant transport system substrate-binding protein|nr:glycine betaine ABC transporter substrate-binding protein [Candidatus Vecturithrix sp.]